MPGLAVETAGDTGATVGVAGVGATTGAPADEPPSPKGFCWAVGRG